MRSLYAVVAAFLRALVVSRAALFFENAALRQQLAVLQHSARRPRLQTSDRVFWVLLSRLWSRWRSVLVIVQPRTVIAWHREGWRLFWKWKSRGGRPAIGSEHRALIRRLSLDNPGWGEDRIRDELRLKLGVDHAASTVRRYMLRPEERGPLGERARSQTWRTFLKNHAREIYACDFVVQWTAAFRVVYVFVVMELGSRRIVCANVTANPTLAWVKQQLRDLCPFDSGPRFLIHDNDGIFGQLGRRGRGKRRFRCHLDRWLSNVLGVEGIPTPYRAPNATRSSKDSTPICGARRSITSCFSPSAMSCVWSPNSWRFTTEHVLLKRRERFPIPTMSSESRRTIWVASWRSPSLGASRTITGALRKGRLEGSRLRPAEADLCLRSDDRARGQRSRRSLVRFKICSSEHVRHFRGVPSRIRVLSPLDREKIHAARRRDEAFADHGGMGVEFRRQVVIGEKFIVDFVAPRQRLVVEVDGRAYHERRRAADARRDRKLARLGYRVLRLEADLVTYHLSEAVARIAAALAEPP